MLVMGAEEDLIEELVEIIEHLEHEELLELYITLKKAATTTSETESGQSR